MAGPVDGVLDWLSGAAGGIDWSGAAVVAATGLVIGGVAAVAAVGVTYWIRHTTAGSGAGEVASVVAAGGLRRWRRARGTDETDRWLCGSCRSWNPPGSVACYRGCGPRETVRMLLPGEVRRASGSPTVSAEDGAGVGEAGPVTPATEDRAADDA